jgi:hypothetical protein
MSSAMIQRMLGCFLGGCGAWAAAGLIARNRDNAVRREMRNIVVTRGEKMSVHVLPRPADDW